MSGAQRVSRKVACDKTQHLEVKERIDLSGTFRKNSQESMSLIHCSWIYCQKCKHSRDWSELLIFHTKPLSTSQWLGSLEKWWRRERKAHINYRFTMSTSLQYERTKASAVRQAGRAHIKTGKVRERTSQTPDPLLLPLPKSNQSKAPVNWRL